MTGADGVKRLEEAGGTQFEQIGAARRLTERRLAERRQQLAALPPGQTAVVLCGSWGRRELTSSSDDDFMILVETPETSLRPSLEEVASALEIVAPAADGAFGEHVHLAHLRDRIGRDGDDNANLTRRMLVVLESVAISGSDVHNRARRELLTRYLEANVRDYRPPRFLLNDLVRYWRTIAVDFESKMRERKGEGWGLRNAKLRLSRKALFAGGLLPVLECHRYQTNEMLDYLDQRMSIPPLDRLADAFLAYHAVDVGIRAFTAYDEFLAILDDPDLRVGLSSVKRGGANTSPIFSRVAELGSVFQESLLSLLFDDATLYRLAREYLVF